MYIIIPIGDIDNDFYRNTYDLPKCLVLAKGTPIIFHVLDYVYKCCSNRPEIQIYIIYNVVLEKYRIKDRISKKYSEMNITFVEIVSSNSCVETVEYIREYINIEKPMMIIDADNYYDIDIIEYWKTINYETFILSVNKDINNKSTITIDNENNVEKITENSTDSNIKCTGVYAFNKSNIYFENCLH